MYARVDSSASSSWSVQTRLFPSDSLSSSYFSRNVVIRGQYVVTGRTSEQVETMNSAGVNINSVLVECCGVR
jgi:hypothetical protein